ncbi:hypothetical protein [Photorhabdus cinerea]|uniref:Uncharacterized protein n=1 Tax=Photorhabdus cinerea TaxID=471575 RepID=A0A7X5QCL1_9GAMM|nr:hypothetical protein [Photorhabdus cinerea]NHB91841.1 hypothetical protein [Photorhabdus cinerea]
MNNRDMLFPIIKDDIAFDTLLTQAKTVIEQQSGQYWNDMGENDPGITLLEACCYGTSDLAYRHSLPLKDLLTPKQEERAPDDGIFPKEFGPQKILTCGPINEEDYRRALLDLHSNDESDGYFFFNDIQLIREPENQRYTYWYDKKKREYSFTQSSETGSSSEQLTLRGNYWLYFLPDRKTIETEANKNQAQKNLEDFLKNNRNLGESVSKIIWLEPVDLPLRIDIQLDNDVKDIADIFAQIYITTERAIAEKPLRYTTQEMKEMGYSHEEIFDGPYLHHGWIPALPPVKDYNDPMVLNLSPLVNQLLAIKGVQSVTRFTLDDNNEKISKLPNDNWSWKIDQGCYPRLWGNDPLALITSQASPIIITAKGGIKTTVTKQQLAEKIISEPLINTQPELLNWGKHRKVLNYYPVSNKLPACYGLQTHTQQQIQLHQFMLPFEQVLANGCAELDLLPKLLAFKQRENTVRGIQWPFKENTVSHNIHQSIKSDLINKVNNEVKFDNNDKNYAKELVILDYLLRYFGAQCATPLLLSNSQQSELEKSQDKDFLSTQREYLSQQPDLAYQRNNIRIDKVSALQKRIAARLGLGGECFKETPKLDELPFYLIEHRQLLPIKPNKKFNSNQTPDNIELQDDQIKITQNNTAGHLKQGQVINLEFSEDDNFNIVRLMNLMITEVTENTFTINANNSSELKINLEKIKNAFKKPNNLHWKNSSVWMEDIDYQLVYTDKIPSSDAENKRWITVSDENHFPAMIAKDNEITLKIKSDYEFKVHIAASDRGKKRILLRKDENSKDDFPPKEMASRYCWYLSNYDIEYKLVYASDVSPDDPQNERWITVDSNSDALFLHNHFSAGTEITLKTNPDYEFKAHVVEFDHIKKHILIEKDTTSTDKFPQDSSPWYWYFSGEKHAKTDYFSFVVSVVLNRELIGSGEVDLYKLESWVKAEILAELPAHISLVIHWLSPKYFKNFANIYKHWQNSGAPLGDTAYEILKTLTLGKLPSTSSKEESQFIVKAV